MFGDIAEEDFKSALRAAEALPFTIEEKGELIVEPMKTTMVLYTSQGRFKRIRYHRPAQKGRSIWYILSFMVQGVVYEVGSSDLHELTLLKELVMGWLDYPINYKVTCKVTPIGDGYISIWVSEIRSLENFQLNKFEV